VDGCCEGKNAWDEAVKTLILRILDINLLKWEDHLPKSIDKLRPDLDKEFEYLENEPSIVGF
jgi:hypothetical protein